MPPKGGDGEMWFDVSPRRGKGLRQGGRGRRWLAEEQRRSDRKGTGDHHWQHDYRGSHRSYHGSDSDYVQDRFARYGEIFADGSQRRAEAQRRGRSRRRVDGMERRQQRRVHQSAGERRQLARAASSPGEREATATTSSFRRYVTFYFTNFPSHLSNFYLRKGFEVCGILEEVVVPRRCNVKGERYGFVRFSNVRDVCKLLKAVNAVSFGNFQIKAKVAIFDKAAARVAAKGIVDRVSSIDAHQGMVGSGRKGAVGDALKARDGENVAYVRDAMVGGSTVAAGTSVGNGVLAKGVETPLSKARSAQGEDVQVGKVLVRLGQGPRQEQETCRGQGATVTGAGRTLKVGGQPSIQNLVRKYRSTMEDLAWARNGVTATVLNGESIPIVQDRITDAGMLDIDITPLGADKVFLRSKSEVSITTMLHDAKEFFAHFFINIVWWEKNIEPFQRGAWVRLFGIPLHAWNEIFFKLCTMDVGRFLRTDSCTKERERFDYARVLVATHSFEIINCSEKLLIDGVLVTVKLVEEWGFNIGDDVCLYEEDVNGSSDEQDDKAKVRSENERNDGNVDLLVDKIVQDMAEASDIVKSVADLGDVVGRGSVADKVVEEPVTSTGWTVDANVTEFQSTLSPPSGDQLAGSDKRGIGSADLGGDDPGGGEKEPVRKQRDIQTASCPPRAELSMVSGPWSLAWLGDHHHSDTGAMPAPRKIGKMGGRMVGRRMLAEEDIQKRKKVKGTLRHSVHSLKKVARLPAKDRASVMHILKKNARKFKGSSSLKKAVKMISEEASEASSSSSSVNNNDWQHWVVLHGSESVVREDVRSLGEAIGVRLSGCNNRFGVLARKGKGNKAVHAGAEGEAGGEVVGES